MVSALRLYLVMLLKSLLRGVRFRGKGTILSALCPRDKTVTINLFGYSFACDLSEHIQRCIFLYGYDDEAQNFIEKTLKEGDVFLDIGANVGFYSLLAASIIGEKGRVIAIEPNPKTYAKLKRTIEDNGIKNILLLNIGLGEKEGYLNLFMNPDVHNDTATMVVHDAPESVRVEVVPLDWVAAAHHIEKIAYLKIDVDGMEPNVFAGAKTLLDEGRIAFIQSEFNDYWLRKNESTPEKLHTLLLGHGFEDMEGRPHFAENCLFDRIFVKRQA